MLFLNFNSNFVTLFIAHDNVLYQAQSEIRFPSKITGNPAGWLGRLIDCLPAGRFAMTAIGNGDMLVRPQDHRLGTPSLSGLTSERNIRPDAQIFDSLLEVREWDVYDFTNGPAMQFSIRYFWSVFAISLRGRKEHQPFRRVVKSR